MTTIGLVGAGSMGSAIGASLRGNGYEVRTTLAGRSPRTAGLVAKVGLDIVDDLVALVAASDIVLIVTPPGAALAAAADVADAARAAGARPLVADLNAVSPATMRRIADALGDLDLVDGSISGAPPSSGSHPVVYLSGPRAGELAGLTWAPARAVVVGDAVGEASAVKMCTASVYKGLAGLLSQALRTAGHFGVLAHVLSDLSGMDSPHTRVALAATKAHRYVAEMLEIASTQQAAGLTPDLFEAYAEVFDELARTPLAAGDPETLDRSLTPAQVIDQLRPG